MDRQLSDNFPAMTLRVDDFPDRKTFDGIQKLIRDLRKLQLDFVAAFNFSEIGYVSQNGQPTLEQDTITVWHDADATGGNPTHYIVINAKGTTVTFASEETA